MLLFPVTKCRGIAVGGSIEDGGVEKQKTLPNYSSISRGSMVRDSTASEMAVAWPPVDVAVEMCRQDRSRVGVSIRRTPVCSGCMRAVLHVCWNVHV